MEQTQLFLKHLTLTEDLKWACYLPVHKDLMLKLNYLINQWLEQKV